MGYFRRLAAAWLAAATLLGAGCGGVAPVGEVQGTLRAGGAPLANVMVEFLPDPEKGTSGPRSAGTTDEQGRFRLRCDDGRDGALVGWHRVVLADLADERTPQGQTRKTAQRIPGQYTTATTPLRKEVKEGQQTIDLEVSK